MSECVIDTRAGILIIIFSSLIAKVSRRRSVSPAGFVCLLPACLPATRTVHLVGTGAEP